MATTLQQVIAPEGTSSGTVTNGAVLAGSALLHRGPGIQVGAGNQRLPPEPGRDQLAPAHGAKDGVVGDALELRGVGQRVVVVHDNTASRAYTYSTPSTSPKRQ